MGPDEAARRGHRRSAGSRVPGIRDGFGSRPSNRVASERQSRDFSPIIQSRYLRIEEVVGLLAKNIRDPQEVPQ